MRISFRQGLISFQRDGGLPVYLQPSTTTGYVSHIIAPTPTVVAFAHGASDYLAKFVDSTPNAWGPVVPDITNHLYWDIDQLTAVVTRGITTIEPIYSSTEPLNPVNDQHWFDKSEMLMKVWSTPKSKWFTKIRLFAGSVLNGNLGTIRMFNDGTQAGLIGPANPGFIMLDSLLRPLRKASQHGEFLTANDEARVLSTVGTAGVLVQPVNKVVPVRAGEPIPKMSLVYFSDDDVVKLASSNPALIPGRPPVGIMIDAIDKDEIGSLVQSGEISYDQWDFSGNAGKPVYCDQFGQITMARPAGLMAFRVGFVKNRTTLLVNIDAETTPQVYTATPGQLIIVGDLPVTVSEAVNGIGERVVTIGAQDANSTAHGLMPASAYNQVIDNTTRISTIELVALPNKSDKTHTHALGDLTNVDLTTAPPSLNEVLTFNGSQWIPSVPAVHAYALGDLTNVDLSTAPPAVDNVLVFNGTKWVPSAPVAALPVHTHALSTLSDVDTISIAPTVNDVLTYNGVEWAPAPAPVGGGGGASAQPQMYVLTAAQYFGSEANPFYPSIEPYVLASPYMHFNPYTGALVFLQNGIYKITLSLNITPPTDLYGPGFWPDALTAYGTGIFFNGAGSIIGPSRTTHTRFSNANDLASSNHGIGSTYQSADATDIYYVSGGVDAEVHIMAYTASYNGNPFADPLTFNVICTIEQLSPSMM